MSKRSHQTRGIQNGAPDWSNAVRHNQFYRPVKQQTSIHLDADVLAWFKAQGKGYQTRMNEILRDAMLKELKNHQ